MKKVLSIALALLLVIGLVSFAKPASADASREVSAKTETASVNRL